MIHHDGGRSRSVRTLDEMERSLVDQIEHLSAEERETFELMLQEIAQGTDPGDSLVEICGNAEWKKTPVDIETFVKDPYYLGLTCENIYPKLLDDLVELFEGGYSEAVLTGSIGWGKTFYASIGVCRILYELSCMRDPQKSFGLASGSGIAITNMSVNEALAMKVVFDNIATKIKASPYFQENFPFQSNRKELRFPNSIWVAARAATDTSALGLNTIAGIVDETNFMGKLFSKDKSAPNLDLAESIYATMKRRMKSRFERQGRLPGILFMVSSKKTNDDFTARRVREATEDPSVFVRDYAMWEVKPEDYYSSRTFWVLVGNEHVPSRILAPGEEKEFQDLPVENTVLVEVPEDFRTDFNSDLEGAIRDIAGVATVAVNPYIQRRDRITAAVNQKRSHPFSSQVYDPSRRGVFLWDSMVRQRTERAPGGIQETRLRPILNPLVHRQVHIDPSLRGDSTGFAMSHIGGWKDVVRRAEDGTRFMEKAPIYVVDLALRIVPPIGGEIVLAELRHLVYDLTAHGYLITGVSLDSWQCLAEGTRVATTRGLIPIEEVRPGDLVVSREGPARVLNTFAYPETETLRIETTDGDVLEGTGKHRIEAATYYHDRILPESIRKHGKGPLRGEPRWEWDRLDELQVGQVIRMVDQDLGSECLLIDSAPLSGDKGELGWGAGGRPGTLDSWELPVRMTPELAEWLGLIWGNGDIGHDSIRLTLTEAEYPSARRVFESLFGFCPEFSPHPDRNCGLIRISSRWFIRWLHQNKLEKPLIPEAIFRSPPAVQAAFLRGLFATDGWVSLQDGGAYLSSALRALVEQVQVLLRSTFGFESNLMSRRPRDGRYAETEEHVLSVRGSRALFAEKIGFSYQWKDDLLRTHAGVPGRRIFTKIARILPSRSRVFDLEVEGDPSYTANGFVSHNSADSIQQFKAQGYRSEILSVDTSPDPYDNLKTALYEDRVDMYPYPPLTQELETLQEDRRGKKRKIDHPARGSKDVADAVAATFFLLQKYSMQQPLPMLANQQSVASDPWMEGSQGFSSPQPQSPTSGSNSGILPPFFGGGLV